MKRHSIRSLSSYAMSTPVKKNEKFDKSNTDGQKAREQDYF